MAVYCMSDIHGKQQAFHKMLEMIHFGSEDRLYLIGDVVDRGKYGIDLLHQIMETPNITMLLGNHEYMMLDYFKPDATEKEIKRWNKNGNAPTKEAYLALSEAEQKKITAFLQSLPAHLELSVAGRDYYLVHGYPADTVKDCVWDRPESLEFPNPVSDRRLIIGHTPVPYMLCEQDADLERYYADLHSRGDHTRILHTPGFIDIDCGSGYTDPGSALACLRLDDMKEFYVVFENGEIQ